MMKASLFLLLAVLFPTISASCDSSCPLDRKIKELVSCEVASQLDKADLDCRDVITNGADATCPSGFKATGCSCGKSCGSWDIRNGITCHCQCAAMDWASARCCKFALNK